MRPDIPPVVSVWPPPGDAGTTLGAPSAWIDIDTNTITVSHGYDPSGGQVLNTYSYGPVAAASVPAIGPLGASLLASLILGTALLRARKPSQQASGAVEDAR